MAHDWAADAKKHVPDAEDSAIRSIVRDCGIALHSRDGSAVTEVCDRMNADRDKSRVTFCYLLAEKYGKLAMFR